MVCMIIATNITQKIWAHLKPQIHTMIPENEDLSLVEAYITPYVIIIDKVSSVIIELVFDNNDALYITSQAITSDNVPIITCLLFSLNWKRWWLKHTNIIQCSDAVVVIPDNWVAWIICPYLNTIFFVTSVWFPPYPTRVVHCDVTTRGHPPKTGFSFKIAPACPYTAHTTVPYHIWNEHRLFPITFGVFIHMLYKYCKRSWYSVLWYVIL